MNAPRPPSMQRALPRRPFEKNLMPSSLIAQRFASAVARPFSLAARLSSPVGIVDSVNGDLDGVAISINDVRKHICDKLRVSYERKPDQFDGRLIAQAPRQNSP